MMRCLLTKVNVSFFVVCCCFLLSACAVEHAPGGVSDLKNEEKSEAQRVDLGNQQAVLKNPIDSGADTVSEPVFLLKDKYEPEPLVLDGLNAGRSSRKVGDRSAKEGIKSVFHTERSTDVLPAGTLLTNSDDDESFVINMEDAALYEVILFFINKLGMNCIVEPNIGGNITIRTAGKLNKSDLLPLFYQILEVNGLTAVKEGKFYRIVDMANVSRTAIPFADDETHSGNNPGMVLQIIPLHFIKSDEMIKILTPFISEKGSLVSHVDSNTLLLIDSNRNVEKVLKLVRSFDVDFFKSIGYKFFKINHVDSTSIVETITEALSFYNNEKNKIKIINLEKMNSLLVLSDNERVFAKISDLLADLDHAINDVESHIFLYFLKNSRAEDMGNLLNSIFTKRKEEIVKIKQKNAKEGKSTNEKNPFALTAKVDSVKLTRKTTGSDFGSGALRGEIKIIEDRIRNALLIDAIPSDYRIVERLLKRLDVLPRQVLVSVTIVDIQLDDDLELGVEWKYVHTDGNNVDPKFFLSAAAGNAGLGFAIGETLKWDARLSALATKKKVDIIATPSVLASDNIAANIDISTEIPVASAQIQYDDSNINKTQTNIQYRNTGIILNVTPHINENGLVSMDLKQEVSEQSTAVKVGNSTYPSFFKRSVNTTLTVGSGQTIAIGGLIREVKSKSSSGVPWLSDIPVIGWIFGKDGRDNSKSELIIFITPRVVATSDDIDAVTAEFASKVGYEFE